MGWADQLIHPQSGRSANVVPSMLSNVSGIVRPLGILESMVQSPSEHRRETGVDNGLTCCGDVIVHLANHDLSAVVVVDDNVALAYLLTQ